MKTLVVILIIAIIIVLGSGLVFLVKDGSKDRRLVRSLTLRIGLSVVVFLLLFIGYYLGLIQPHGVYPQ